MEINEISGHAVDVANNIHRSLGPGLLESVYKKIMSYELKKRGLAVIEEQPIPVIWEDVRLELGFRADLIVQQKVVVELKSIDAIAPVHKKQLLTYLRLADKRLGLLMNFNVELMKDGIYRIANNL